MKGLKIRALQYCLNQLIFLNVVIQISVTQTSVEGLRLLQASTGRLEGYVLPWGGEQEMEYSFAKEAATLCVSPRQASSGKIGEAI
jgi:hypothetical protein